MPNNLAKAGDTVTLSFVTSLPIIDKPTVTFANIESSRVTTTNDSGDDITWKAEFDVVSTDNDGDISFTISGKDYSGTNRDFKFAGDLTITPSPGVTIDTTQPQKPEISETENFEITANSTPTIIGEAFEAGLIVKMYDGTSKIGETTSGSDGGWSIVTDSLTDTQYSVYVRSTDAAGNTSDNSDFFTFTVDTTNPTITISSTTVNASGLTTNDTTIDLKFVTSEVTTNFISGDIDVSNGGELSNFSGSGKVYTATLINTATNTTYTIDVAANKFTDAAGNGNTAAQQFTWTRDTEAPTLSFIGFGVPVGDTAYYKAEMLLGLTATFNEAVKLTNTNSPPTLTLSNGGVATYSTGNNTGTLIFEYNVINSSTETTDLQVSEYTANGGIEDLAGNAFSGTISGNDGGTVVIDNTAPTMTISNNAGVISGNSTGVSVESIVFKFEANETTDGDFASGDINIEEKNGEWQSSEYTSGNVGFVSSNNKTYTVTLANINSGTYRLSVDANTFTDLAGNNNTASNKFEITYV